METVMQGLILFAVMLSVGVWTMGFLAFKAAKKATPVQKALAKKALRYGADYAVGAIKRKYGR